MATISKSIEIGAKANKIYSQCIRFEKFPHFLERLNEVRQISHNCLYWRAEFPGQELEWEVQIEAQVPDQRISWRCSIGASNSGSVDLEKLEENLTRVRFELSLPDPPLIPGAGRSACRKGPRGDGKVQDAGRKGGTQRISWSDRGRSGRAH